MQGCLWIMLNFARMLTVFADGIEPMNSTDVVVSGGYVTNGDDWYATFERVENLPACSMQSIATEISSDGIDHVCVVCLALVSQ